MYQIGPRIQHPTGISGSNDSACPYYQKALDSLAHEFAAAMNELNHIYDDKVNLLAGGNLFSMGSATNDAGAGLLQALGVRLLDKNGNDLAHGGAALANLTTIDISTMDPALKNVAITAACDVTNPLTGPTGASAVFGPQKGASKDDVPHWTPPSRILRR